MDGDYNQATSHSGGAISQIDMQDRDPYTYRARYDTTFLESSPNNGLNAGFDGNPPITHPQRSRGLPVSRSAPLVLDPRDHLYTPPDRSPPPSRPERSIARRSRPPVWEVVSTDQDDSQEYYVGGLGGAARRDPNTGVANLSRRRSSKSNLHPILQNFSSPISTCSFL